MFFSIYIYSKNYNSLSSFNEFISNKLYNFKFTKTNRQINKTVITVLKSPHVNKTAQERFYSDYFTKNFVVKSTNPYIILFVLKVLKEKVFLDVKFKIKLLSKNSCIKNIIKKKSTPNRLSLINVNKNLTVYLDVLNNYGKSVLI